MVEAVKERDNGQTKKEGGRRREHVKSKHHSEGEKTRKPLSVLLPLLT